MNDTLVDIDNEDLSSMRSIPEDWTSTCLIYDISMKISDKQQQPHDDTIPNTCQTTTNLKNDDDVNESSSSSSVSVIRHVSSTKIQCAWEIQFVRDPELGEASPGETATALALVQPVSPLSTDIDPYFCYRLITTTAQSPILKAIFEYQKRSDTNSDDDDNEEWILESVHVKCAQLPEPWPSQAQKHWEEWLRNNVNNLIQKEEEYPMSYTICEFLLHEALDYFCVTKKYTKNNTDYNNDIDYSQIIICMDYPVTEEFVQAEQQQQQHRHSNTNSKLEIYRSQNEISECSLLFTSMTPLEHQVRTMIHTCYKHWIRITCPICLEDTWASEAFSLIPCQHYFCHECITTYAQTIVQDLSGNTKSTQNPFICPLPSCRQPLRIFKCIKGLLDKKTMDTVRAWYKNLKHPPCEMLVVCPRTTKCGKRGQMRKSSYESSMVYCDACGGTWCELCLQRYSTNDGGEHYHCDQFPVLRLCDRYRDVVNKCQEEDEQEEGKDENDNAGSTSNNQGTNTASQKSNTRRDAHPRTIEKVDTKDNQNLKIACEAKWPWLREYAAARYVESSIIEWVKNNAAMCPGCHTGIERLEGCFHMKCTVCGTHFCYECGKELFAPYYGTHHCWLEDDTMVH